MAHRSPRSQVGRRAVGWRGLLPRQELGAGISGWARVVLFWWEEPPLRNQFSFCHGEGHILVFPPSRKSTKTQDRLP